LHQIWLSEIDPAGGQCKQRLDCGVVNILAMCIHYGNMNAIERLTKSDIPGISSPDEIRMQIRALRRPNAAHFLAMCDAALLLIPKIHSCT
jgi:hypothetical protein